jgi:fucose permease
MGDIFGPALFAFFMGTGRVLFGIWGAKIKPIPAMVFSAVLCIFCYAGIVFASHPVVQLAACAVTGFSVSIMWPVAFSLSSARFPLGGTALFAILALMGDLGAASGPWLVGIASDAASSGAKSPLLPLFLSPLESGILVCIIFPVLFLVSVVLFGKSMTKNSLTKLPAGG